MFLGFKSLTYKVINEEEILDVILSSKKSKIFSEQLIINHCNTTLRKLDPPIDLVIVNWQSDLLLANSSLFKSLLNVRKIEAIIKFRRGVRESAGKSYLIPMALESPKYIYRKPVESVTSTDLLIQKNILFSIAEISNLFKNVPSINFSFIILSTDTTITDISLAIIRDKISSLNKDQIYPYFIKPHPNLKFTLKTVELIEKSIGYQSLNLKDSNSINLINAIPIEVILMHYINSKYVGIFTGGINYTDASKINFILTGYKSQDKMYKIYTSQSFKYMKINLKNLL